MECIKQRCANSSIWKANKIFLYLNIYEINHKSILIEYENDKRGNYLNDPINLKSNKHLIRGDPFVYLLACLLHIRVNKRYHGKNMFNDGDDDDDT